MVNNEHRSAFVNIFKLIKMQTLKYLDTRINGLMPLSKRVWTKLI